MWQAERLQQYRDTIAQESEAALARASVRAQSNLEQIVDQLSQEEVAQQDNQARSVIISGPAAMLVMYDARLLFATFGTELVSTCSRVVC